MPIPTAAVPIYYAPYMKALYDSTKIGQQGATLETLRDQQLYYDVQLDPTGMPVGATPATKAAEAFDKDHADQSNALGNSVIRGVALVQQGMHAADPSGTWKTAPVARYQFSTSPEGAIAGRMDTALRTNPTMLDRLKPEEVAGLASSIIDQSAKDMDTNDVRFSGDTMDLGPKTMARMMQSVTGKPLGVEDAVFVADQIGRQVQSTVTPTDPAKAGGPTAWMDGATDIVGAHWPGALAKVAEAMEISKDYAKIEDLGKQLRMNDDTAGPQATYVRSLKSLLGAAGVDVEKAEAAPAAFQLLQAKPQDEVPAGVVQAILAKAKLPTDAAGYFTQRLADTGGQDGNVKGLLDSIELARRDAEAAKKPPPVDPKTPPPTDPNKPPTDPPPVEPPPTDPKLPPVEPPSTDPGPPNDPDADPAPDPGAPDPANPDPANPDPNAPVPGEPEPGNTGTPGVPGMPGTPGTPTSER